MQIIKPKGAISVRISGDRLTMCLTEEEEADQESGIGSGSSTSGSTASAEDVESPKSVVAASSLGPGGAWRKSDGECFHIQVKRLEEESSHLGEDVWEGISANCKKTFNSVDDAEDDVVFLSKTGILPASPLGGIRTPQSSSA